MAKYVTRTVETYEYQLGKLKSENGVTTIEHVASVAANKKLGERAIKAALKQAGADVNYRVDTIPHKYAISVETFMELAEEIPIETKDAE